MLTTKMDRVLRAVGRELAAERTRRGYTQKYVADHAKGDVSYKQVGKIERGEAGQFVEAFLVADVLGVSLSDLIAAAEAKVAAGEDAAPRKRRVVRKAQ